MAQVEKVSSVDNATLGSGNTLNEVKFTYNGLGQLTKDEQDHDSAVDGSTPSVQYAYTESTANNHSRLDTITYPNGRLLYMRYTHSATSTWQDETNDAFSRIGQLAASSSTDPYIEYTFAGSGRLVKRKAADGSGNKGNDTQLNLDGGTADEYAGLDLFGRVVDQVASAVISASSIKSQPQYRAKPRWLAALRRGAGRSANIQPREQLSTLFASKSLTSNRRAGRRRHQDDAIKPCTAQFRQVGTNI